MLRKKKKKKISIEELRRENERLRKKRMEEEELKRLKRENFLLRHGRLVSLTKKAGKVGKVAAKKLISSPQRTGRVRRVVVTPSRTKRKKIRQPYLSIGDFI